MYICARMHVCSLPIVIAGLGLTLEESFEGGLLKVVHSDDIPKFKQLLEDLKCVCICVCVCVCVCVWCSIERV